MTIARRFALVFVTCLFCSGAIAAQVVDLRVRLIYLKNEKPANGQQIILYEGDPQRMSAAEWRSQSRAPKETTSRDGVAVFRVPKPLPKTVSVSVENGRIRACASGPEIPLEEVMTHGVTIGVDKEFGGSCKGDRTVIKRLAAKPGEIVVFVRKLSIWEKMQN